MAEGQGPVQDATTLQVVETALIDQQIATARKYPRDENTAVDKAIRLATYSSKIAQSCIYFRPVGKKDGVQTFVVGPSIRLAEVLKTSWGNLRLATRVIGEQDGNIHVQAGCHDLESNVFETNEVAKSITGRNGRYSESMTQVVIGAASKIALRNVIFSIIPKAYVEQIMDACKEEIVGTDENRTDLMKALAKAFGEMGVTEDMLMSAVDQKEYPAGSNDEVVFLIGLHNAIKDGICSVDECFGKQSSKPSNVEMPQEVTGKKKGGKKKGEAKKDAKAEAPKVAPESGGDPSFADTLRATALQGGITDDAKIVEILSEKFSIGSLEEVPPERMNEVIDHFIALAG